MGRKVLLASSNKHKLEEFRALLEPLGLRVLSPAEVGGLPDVEEDGQSFAENAAKKACEIAKAKGMACFSDDSGLAVAALGGRPGIHSARYAGPGADDRQNCRKLLRELAGQGDRRAAFVCVIAVADAQGQLLGTVEGRCEGHVAVAESGDSGFGYDPLFIPVGYERSFAELGPQIKNSLSHRAQALQALIRSPWLADLSLKDLP